MKNRAAYPAEVDQISALGFTPIQSKPFSIAGFLQAVATTMTNA